MRYILGVLFSMLIISRQGISRDNFPTLEMGKRDYSTWPNEKIKLYTGLEKKTKRIYLTFIMVFFWVYNTTNNFVATITNYSRSVTPAFVRCSCYCYYSY